MTFAATRIHRFAACAVLLWLGVSASADDWPQWRGPAGTGASNETRLPETWNDTRNIAWKARLAGVGVSSPVVWGDRVFVTSQVGQGGSRQGPRLGQGGNASSAERSLTARTVSVPGPSSCQRQATSRLFTTSTTSRAQARSLMASACTQSLARDKSSPST